MKKKTRIGVALVVGLFMVLGLAAYAQFKMPDVSIPGVKKEDLDRAKGFVEDSSEALKPWSFKEERATGRVVAAMVAKNFGGIWNDAAWTEYVNLVGRSLVPYSERNDIKYRFAILNSNDVNAFACPGGYIFITRGLLKRIKSEAQLAGVLAHEIGHVSGKHIEKGIKAQKMSGVALDHGLSFAASEGKLTSEQAEIIKGVGSAGYDVLVKTGYARADEFEADRLGTENIYKMGYPPNALKGLLNNLGADKSDSAMKILVSTHPSTEDRIENINKCIKKNGYSPEGRSHLAERYEKMMSEHPIP